MHRIAIFALPFRNHGLVVQLVRIRACHARGRGFESRPDRKKYKPCQFGEAFLFYVLRVYNIFDKY